MLLIKSLYCYQQQPWELPLYNEQFLIIYPAANLRIHSVSLFTIASPRDQRKENTKSISILIVLWATPYVHLEEKEMWHTKYFGDLNQVSVLYVLKCKRSLRDGKSL